MPAASLVILDEAASTQEEARNLLKAGHDTPVWVLALTQTAGRGRRGRDWASTRGNLTCSLLLREDAPARRLPELSFLAALAAHKAICALAMQARAPHVQDALQLKWPNDLLLDGEKLGGILLESEPARDSERAVIIGFGINLLHAPQGPNLRWPATSLAHHGLCVEPAEAISALDDSFMRWRDVWKRSGFAPVRKAWMKRAWGLGEKIAFNAPAGRVEGVFRGLGDDGALLLETDEGLQSFHAGDVEHVKLAQGSA